MRQKSHGRRGGRTTRTEIVRRLRAWVHDPQTLDMLYGPQLSHFEKEDKVRRIFGLAPLAKSDIPPGENWDAIPPRTLLTRKEKDARVRQILDLPPEDPGGPGPENGQTALNENSQT